jgi:signal transduction histidine kinase
LGLSIATWIAQAHGATIEVESALNAGSRFTVRFPKR